ncbi:hypothetical protein [Clostridium butyricum]
MCELFEKLSDEQIENKAKENIVNEYNGYISNLNKNLVKIEEIKLRLNGDIYDSKQVLKMETDLTTYEDENINLGLKIGQYKRLLKSIGK